MEIERDIYRKFVTESSKSEENKKKNESFEPDMEMEIVSFGIQDGLERFELDGTEFYKDEDETLENAIDTCIDEEFFPDWQEDGAMSYNVDSVKYDAKSGRGTAYVSVYSEVEESANESTLDMDRGRVDFDTFGGAITVSTDAYGRYGDGRTYVGLNGMSRGNIYFAGPELDDLENRRAVYTWEQDIRQKVQEFLKQTADEFDAKVDAFMKELGYERQK